jgi:hypothetical protein
MNEYHLDARNLPTIVRDVVALAFPHYRGRKFSVRQATAVNCRSYWDGGSKNTFVWVRLDTMQALALPSSHPYYDSVSQSVEALPTAPGLVCVEHSIFCGQDMGITFHVHPASGMNLIPPSVELTTTERVVLAATAGYKSSYNGKTRRDMANDDLRWAKQSPISVEGWDAAKASLIHKGLLNKAGAIIPAGRNVAPSNIRAIFSPEAK